MNPPDPVAPSPLPERPANTPPARLPRWRRIARILAPWLIELVIVFIGVYAAFALTQYQAERETIARREQIVQALVREIEDIAANTRRVAERMPDVLAYYDSTMAAGAMPALEPLIEPVRVQTHMWEAALESGGLDVLDVPTMYRLSAFYNMLNAGFEQLAQLRHLSETVLLPNAGRGPEEFYDPTTKQLRPKYTWYLDGLRNLSGVAQNITTLGDSIVADLKTKKE